MSGDAGTDGSGINVEPAVFVADGSLDVVLGALDIGHQLGAGIVFADKGV